MKTMTKLSAILLAALTCAAWPATAQDATAPAPPATTNTAPRPPRNPRYTGVIESIDGTNMILTLKVANRESKVKITSATRISKDRQPATFADAVVGLRVTGSAKKGDDGILTATTLNIMTKPRTPPPAATQSQKTE